jgi:hypothetical protein
MAWASEDDVVAITGREAAPESLALAQTVVELFSGTTELASDEGLISSRNLRLLQQAVAFQAVWLDSHPDVLDALDVQGVSQDGLNAQYATANAHLLAPFAARCIARLSWRRDIRIGHRRGSAASDRGNRDSAAGDDQYAWTPMPFGSTP